MKSASNTANEKQKFIIAIRIRPFIDQDQNVYKPSEIEPILSVDNDTTLTIQRKNSEQKIFRFNHIFLEQTQQQIYQKSKHLVQSVFQGHNATFLAYGQTGTGKTHTIFGSKGNQANGNSKGYFHRAVLNIFGMIKEKMHSRQFAVRVSFVEFYLDNIYDLIQNNGVKLQIKQTSDDGIHIKDAAQIPVKSAQQLFNCVKLAILNRKTQQTSINKRSSRSHAIIQIQVLQRWNELNGQTRYQKGMLKIVDLAGSERVSKTQSFGPRLEQAKRINKQITTLGKCINLLAQSQKQTLNNKSNVLTKFNFSKTHIPFRDSKITRYLTDTLQGRSKIMLCICVSQYSVHLQQTFSSLMFATQASTLKVESKRNQVYSMTRSTQKTPKKQSQTTPIKTKTQSKNQYDILLRQKRDDGAIQRILVQIQQIEDYLDGKGLNPSKQPKVELQKNLLAYQKIFTIMRKKVQKEHSRKTSSINYP